MTDSSSSALTRVGEPVWYQRSKDDGTWWPGIRFPNVWTAYAVCHEEHLNDKQDQDLHKALFDAWTLFGLEQTVAGRQEQPVLARLAKGPRLELVLLGDDGQQGEDSSSVRSFFQVTTPPVHTQTDAWKEALEHLQQLLSSPHMRRDIVGRKDGTSKDVSSSSASSSPSGTSAAHGNTQTVTPVPPLTTTTTTTVTAGQSRRSSLSRSRTIQRATTLPTSTHRRVSEVPVPTTTNTVASFSNNDAPPIEGDSILPDENWTAVYKKLEFSGFTRQPSARGPIFVKPNGRRERPDDVFTTVQALQEFCRQAYGWLGPKPAAATQQAESSDDDEEEEEDDDESQSEVPTAMYDTEDDNTTIRTESVASRRRHHHRPPPSPAVSAMTGPSMATRTPDQPTRPQDPGKPLLDSAGAVSVASSVGNSSVEDSVASDSSIAANRYWASCMKPQGWTWQNGHSGNEYHFVAPGVDHKSPKAKLGVDYFASVMDAFLYETNRPPRQLGRGARRGKTANQKVNTKNKIKHKAPVEKTSPTAKTASTKASKLTKKLEQASSAKKATPTNSTAKRNGKGGKISEAIIEEPFHWSKIRPMLTAYSGFSLHKRSQLAYKGVVLDEITVGLALLECGIPQAVSKKASWMGHILTWLRHLTARFLDCSSVDCNALQKSDYYRLKGALNQLGFSCSGGKIYIPGTPHTRGRQTESIHFFFQDDIATKFANHFRCHFSEYIPERPTAGQSQALCIVAGWLVTVPEMELPKFSGFPNTNDKFWDRLNLAARVLAGKENVPTRVQSKKKAVEVELESEDDDASKSPSVSSRDNSPFWSDSELELPLATLGYKKTVSGAYTHPSSKDGWQSLSDLRDFMGHHGVYNYTSLKKKLDNQERKALYLWVFARQVTPDQYFDRNSIPKMNEEEAKKLLRRAGWWSDAERWIRPGAGLNERVPSIDIFKNLAEVARQVNLHDWALTDNLSNEDASKLRLWALNPLRVDLEYEAPTKRRRGPSNMEDNMLPYYNPTTYANRKKKKFASSKENNRNSSETKTEESTIKIFDGDLNPTPRSVPEKKLGIHDVQVCPSPSRTRIVSHKEAENDQAMPDVEVNPAVEEQDTHQAMDDENRMSIECQTNCLPAREAEATHEEATLTESVSALSDDKDECLGDIPVDTVGPLTQQPEEEETASSVQATKQFVSFEECDAEETEHESKAPSAQEAPLAQTEQIEEMSFMDMAGYVRENEDCRDIETTGTSFPLTQPEDASSIQGNEMDDGEGEKTFVEVTTRSCEEEDFLTLPVDQIQETGNQQKQTENPEEDVSSPSANRCPTSPGKPRTPPSGPPCSLWTMFSGEKEDTVREDFPLLTQQEQKGYNSGEYDDDCVEMDTKSDEDLPVAGNLEDAAASEEDDVYSINGDHSEAKLDFLTQPERSKTEKDTGRRGLFGGLF